MTVGHVRDGQQHAHLALVLAPLGNVTQDQQKRQRGVFRIPREACLDRHRRAVEPSPGDVDALVDPPGGLLRDPEGRQQIVEHRPLVLRNQHRHVLTDDVGFLVTEQRAGAVTPHRNGATGVEPDHGVRAHREQMTHARVGRPLPAASSGGPQFAGNGRQQAPQVGLGDVVARARLQGLHGRFLAQRGRDENARHHRRRRLRHGQGLPPTETGHGVVGQHQIPVLLQRGGQRRFGRHPSPMRCVSATAQVLDQQQHVVGRVVNHQHSQQLGLAAESGLFRHGLLRHSCRFSSSQYKPSCCAACTKASKSTGFRT